MSLYLSKYLVSGLALAFYVVRDFILTVRIIFDFILTLIILFIDMKILDILVSVFNQVVIKAANMNKIMNILSKIASLSDN